MSAVRAANTPAKSADQSNDTPAKFISILTRAEQLVVDMKGKVPEGGLEHGTLHQLSGKTCNGAECTFMIVFLDQAVFGDLSTGIIVTVDGAGRRRTSMIRGAK